MKEEYKKIIKLTSKKIKQAFSCDLNSQRMIDFFFIFFILISFLYTFLIYATAEKIKGETYFVVTPKKPSPLELNLKNMVSGRPIEVMVPYIAAKDRQVAAYMIAIAKKESNWGKYSPKKDGQECWNFWGYRGNENPTLSGYSCFNSPREAVNVVGGRINKLLAETTGTPGAMVVWKCGYNCSWDNPVAVRGWINDVGYYYHRIYE